MEQGEVDNAGTWGSWTAPTVPGQKYSFQVKGGVSEVWNYIYSDWNATAVATTPGNFTTLKQSFDNFQALDLEHILVLGGDRKLWLEHAPFGQVPPSRQQIDGNVLAFQALDAVTIHKSQGSEYPVVILPLFMQHYMLLSRNLLYTGLTRAKQLAIVVGPTKAISFAIKRVMDRQRYTALADRLQRTSISRANSSHNGQSL